jgi:hypothetical protein
MHLRLSLPMVCLAALLAGCGNEGSSSDESGKRPANMCEAVAPAVPKDWKLTKTSAEKSKAKTDCTLADESGKTTLVVTVQKPKSGSSVDDAFKQLCNFYIANAQERDDKRCTQTGPIKLEGSPAELQRGVRLDGSAGVLWMTFRTNNPDVAADAEDVLGEVEDSVSEYQG